MTEQQIQKFKVLNLDGPTRIDRAIRLQFPDFGRRKVQALVNAKKARVNGKVVWMCSWKVKNGDKIELLCEKPEEKVKTSQFKDHWIVRRDSDVIALNKPAGVLSHKTRVGGDDDILSLATEKFGHVVLFHRLDRDTSGVMIFTQNTQINRYLDVAFKAGTIEKEYVALIQSPNELQNVGVISTRMSNVPNRRDIMRVSPHGKAAETHYEVVGEAEGKMLVKLWPKTGRTHQLRVHMQYMHGAILGDRLYGFRKSAKRLMLHAHRITLPEADGYPERSYKAPLPEDFISQLPKALRKLAKNL